MCSIKNVDLQVDKNLLDPKFDSYKLSLNPIKSNFEQLDNEVNQVEPNVDQYSFIHAKLFALHNHLFSDPWNETSVYFIDKNWCVQKGTTDPITQHTSLVTVWQIPENKQLPIYNISLIFSSENTAVVSDGAGTLHIIKTGNRNNNENWKGVFSSTFEENVKEFVVLDAKCLKSEKNTRILNCILMSIDLNLNETNRKNSVVLNWITLNESSDGTSWGATELEQLRGSEIHYCVFNSTCDALYIASNGPFKFLNETNQVPKPLPKLYKWQQTTDDITITLKAENFVKNDLKINSIPQTISINLKDKQIYEFNLINRIDPDLTTWEIKDQLIYITLYKQELGLIWSKLDVNNDLQGEQIIDPVLVEEIHSRLENLCSETEVTEDDVRNPPPLLSSQQLEECDMITDSMLVLERLERKTRSHTHTVAGIGGFQVLFQVQDNNDVGDGQQRQTPAICLRHDVDACVFQFDKENGENLKLCHVGTLHAFGYVQASKQQKKFIGCSPNISYGVIAESLRHIFIYRQQRDITEHNTCQLRNRFTGSRINNIAEQQLITLTPNTNNDDEILGICIQNHVLFVLKSKQLYFYYI